MIALGMESSNGIEADSGKPEDNCPPSLEGSGPRIAILDAGSQYGKVTQYQMLYLNSLSVHLCLILCFTRKENLFLAVNMAQVTQWKTLTNIREQVVFDKH